MSRYDFKEFALNFDKFLKNENAKKNQLSSSSNDVNNNSNKSNSNLANLPNSKDTKELVKKVEPVDFNICYTDSQKQMITDIDAFLNSDTNNVFLLKGYAGTGKTFMLRVIYSYLQQLGPNVRTIICAPTGKASLVINKKIESNQATTIHKAIYDTKFLKDRDFKMNKLLNPDQQQLQSDSNVGYFSDSNIGNHDNDNITTNTTNPNEHTTTKNNHEINENASADDLVGVFSLDVALSDKIEVPIKNDEEYAKVLNLYIFDEASMISNKYSELPEFRFGSGCLLDDIMKFTKIFNGKKHTASSRSKIIFCGDPAQLWPVGMECSPALNANYLKDNYKVNIAECTLYDIQRQKLDSAILANANMLREDIDKGQCYALNFKDGKDFFKIETNLIMDASTNRKVLSNADDSTCDIGATKVGDSAINTNTVNATSVASATDTTKDSNMANASYISNNANISDSLNANKVGNVDNFDLSTNTLCINDLPKSLALPQNLALPKNTHLNLAVPSIISESEHYTNDIADPLLSSYFTLSKGKVSGNVEVVTFTNNDAYCLNQSIRKHLWKSEDEELHAGDKVIIMQNAYLGDDTFLFNGEFALVSAVLEKTEIYQSAKVKKEDLEFIGEDTPYVTHSISPKGYHLVHVKFVVREVVLKKYGPTGEIIEFNCFILENILYSPEKEISRAENNALMAFFNIHSLEMKNLPADPALMSKNQINFLKLKSAIRVKFGYAITCHKAQGSEWENVFVYCPQQGFGPNKEQLYHWYYTAITRASSNLFLVNAPKLSKAVFTSKELVKPQTKYGFNKVGTNEVGFKEVGSNEIVFNEWGTRETSFKEPSSFNQFGKQSNTRDNIAIDSLEPSNSTNNNGFDVSDVRAASFNINRNAYSNNHGSEPQQKQVASEQSSAELFTELYNNKNKDLNMNHQLGLVNSKNSKELSFEDLCLYNGIIDLKGLSAWILGEILKIANKLNITIEEVRSGVSMEQYWLSDDFNTPILNLTIYYSKSNTITKICSSSTTNRIWNTMANELSKLEQKRFIDDKAKEIMSQMESKVKKLVNAISDKVGLYGISFSLDEYQGYRLLGSFKRMTFDEINNYEIEERCETELQFNNKYQITSHKINYASSTSLKEDLTVILANCTISI